jgi:2-polyprenyl-3-methyl-5-hydroxy-6-metoxy-1,4-benzoquinol methylase
MTAAPTTTTAYPLGHADTELERLVTQALIFDPLTEDLLREAGIRAGMRVMDIGCGVGSVSLLAARLVGPAGRVVGVDRSPDAVHAARRHAAGTPNVTFEIGDVNSIRVTSPVDAVIGRLVLMYQPDPAATVRHLASLVRPGGLVVLHEVDLEQGLDSSPPCPLWDRGVSWARETFRRAQISLRQGLHLPHAFARAGLTPAGTRVAAAMANSSGSPVYANLAGILRTVLPIAERLGVVTAEEVGIDTLEARLREEAQRMSAVLVSPILVGVWARVP